MPLTAARHNDLRPREHGHGHAPVARLSTQLRSAWVTSWLQPKHRAVRLMRSVLMFFGLILSTSLPDACTRREAFTRRGLAFAGAYVAMQLACAVSVTLAAGIAGSEFLRRRQPA